MQQTLERPSTSYMERSEKLIECYNRTIHSLGRMIKSKTVNPRFFLNHGSHRGFLNCFLECLSDMGFKEISKQVNPTLDHLRLPLLDFVKAIVDMNICDLNKLSQIHYQIENTQSDGCSFPAEFKKIEHFFNNAKRASDDTAEAGKLILTISSMAKQVSEFKEEIIRFRDVIDHFRDVHELTKTDHIEYKNLIEFDSAKQNVDYLLRNFKNELVTIDEVVRLKHQLFVLKKGFLETVIRFGKRFEEQCGDTIHSANRSLSAWYQWEMLNSSERRIKSQNNNESFDILLGEFKDGIHDHLSTLNVFSKKILLSIRNKERVSSYFLTIINDIDDLISQILKCNITMNMNLRRELRDLIMIVSKTKTALKNSIQEEEKQLSCLPDLIRRRIEYFNREVPEVLSRSNAKEIKLMAMTINTSYRNIERKLKSSIQGDKEVEVDRICQLVKKRYAEIVRSSTRLIKTA